MRAFVSVWSIGCTRRLPIVMNIPLLSRARSAVSGQPERKPAIRAIWSLALKLGLLVALLGAAWYQVFHQRNLAEVLGQVQNPFRPEVRLWMLLVLLLVPLNWSLEAEKWRRLIGPAQQLGRLQALSAVFSGVTLGLFTPNRIGEFWGRLLYLQPRHRWVAVPLSLMGSYAQILVTLLVGSACGMAYTRRHAGQLEVLPEALFPLLLLVFGAGVAVYLSLPYLADRGWVRWLPRRMGRIVRKLRELNSRSLLLALVLSALRFGVFTAQYWLLLRVYGVALPWRAGITAIGTVFLVQSVLPSLAAVELLKRGNIALLVFGVYTASQLSVLATSSTLWLINLVVPALLGYLLLLRRDLFRAGSTS